jgi:rare lipoprotein A
MRSALLPSSAALLCARPHFRLLCALLVALLTAWGAQGSRTAPPPQPEGHLSERAAMSGRALRQAPATHSRPAHAIKVANTRTGLASYYARRFDGRTTASGEKFDNDDMVAAHPFYPFDTKVKVTNLDNGRKVTVRITDRGPYGQNRRDGAIIDLSRAAARRLDMLGDGVTRVRVDVLQWGES